MISLYCKLSKPVPLAELFNIKRRSYLPRYLPTKLCCAYSPGYSKQYWHIYCDLLYFWQFLKWRWLKTLCESQYLCSEKEKEADLLNCYDDWTNCGGFVCCAFLKEVYVSRKIDCIIFTFVLFVYGICKISSTSIDIFTVSFLVLLHSFQRDLPLIQSFYSLGIEWFAAIFPFRFIYFHVVNDPPLLSHGLSESKHFYFPLISLAPFVFVFIFNSSS